MIDQPRRQISGFTLIELIIVIVLLGILSAVALPRFMDLSGDAYTASLKGSASALAAGVNLAHSKYLIAPSTTDFNGDGTDDLAFANGTTKFPTGLRIGGGTTVTPFTSSAAACVGLWNTVLDAGGATVAASTSTTPDFMADATATGCVFNYRGNVGSDAAATKAIKYDSATGAVSVTNL